MTQSEKWKTRTVSASSRAETLVIVMDASRQADVYDISIAEAP